MSRNSTKPIDLSEALESFTSGWVAIDKNNKVIVHAKDFPSICKRVKKSKDVVLVPASKNYFGFITGVRG